MQKAVEEPKAQALGPEEVTAVVTTNPSPTVSLGEEGQAAGAPAEREGKLRVFLRDTYTPFLLKPAVKVCFGKLNTTEMAVYPLFIASLRAPRPPPLFLTHILTCTNVRVHAPTRTKATVCVFFAALAALNIYGITKVESEFQIIDLTPGTQQIWFPFDMIMSSIGR